jgi:hypothetical protein
MSGTSNTGSPPLLHADGDYLELETAVQRLAAYVRGQDAEQLRNVLRPGSTFGQAITLWHAVSGDTVRACEALEEVAQRFLSARRQVDPQLPDPPAPKVP